MNITPIIAFKADKTHKTNKQAVNDIKARYVNNLIAGKDRTEALKEATTALCDIHSDEFFTTGKKDDGCSMEVAAKGLSFIDSMNKLFKKAIKENN